jgi:O-antigen/teichoic acid export membrane protein
LKSYKSIINYLVAAFIAQGSYFILIPLIINYFGDEAFADIELFNVYSNLFFQIFGLNICTAVTIYKYNSKNNEDYLDFSSNIFGFGLFATFFSFLFSTLIILFQPNIWKLNDQLTALLPLGVFFLFSNFWIKNYFVTLKKVKKYRNYQFIIGILKIGSILLLIFILNWLTAFGKIITECIILSSVSIIFIFSEKIKIKSYRFKNDIVRALKFSSPLIIYVIINNLLNYSDQIFISNYFDKTALAIYSLGYRVGMIILIFFGAISNYYSINYYENFENKNHNRNKTYFLIILLFFFSLLIYIFSRYYIEFSTKWVDNNLSQAITVNKIVILSYYINLIFLIYSRELFYLKKTFKISILVSICAIINIVLNFLFLENEGILMAAYTTLISYTILALISIYYMIKSDKENNLGVTLLFSISTILLTIFMFYS